MITKKVERKAAGIQERLMLSMAFRSAKGIRRRLELCRDMHCNAAEFEMIRAEDRRACAVACEETALPGLWQDNGFARGFRYTMNRRSVMETDRRETIPVDRQTAPEELRKKIYRALLQGSIAITYKDRDGMCVRCNGREGPYYCYVQEINYRVSELGRTLMALKSGAVYGMQSASASHSAVLADQMLPQGCVVGEFADESGVSYLMIQNDDTEGKEKKAFSLHLKKDFRVYRVNPHNGKQTLVRDRTSELCVLVMPGDGDLLRFQDAEDEAYLIEYIFQK